MIAIVDYGVGNLFSLRSSLAYLGASVLVTGDAGALAKSDRLILPGVGAFGEAAGKLRRRGLDRAVWEAARAGTPLLGICLGMQLLLERGFEYGEHRGLGLIGGEIAPIRDHVPQGCKIPHMGWNRLQFPEDRPKSPLFQYVDQGEYVYFVHSYFARRCDAVIATVEYGATLTAAVGRENVFGCQFHPEKSGETGLNILRAFCGL